MIPPLSSLLLDRVEAERPKIIAVSERLVVARGLDRDRLLVSGQRYDEAIARGYFAYRTTVEVEGGQQKVYVGIEDTLSGRTTIMPTSFDF